MNRRQTSECSGMAREVRISRISHHQNMPWKSEVGSGAGISPIAPEPIAAFKKASFSGKFGSLEAAITKSLSVVFSRSSAAGSESLAAETCCS